MNILFVAHSPELSGGANRSLLSLMIGLRDRWGICPSVLVPGETGELGQACRQEGIPVYVGVYHSCCTVFRREPRDILRLGKLLAAPLLDRCQARRLERRLPRDFDLIYSNERMVMMGAFLAKSRGIPHVWHVRSFARENGVHYPPGYVHFMARHAERIVPISQALRQSLAACIAPEKLAMVHNGVAVEDYEVPARQPHEDYRLLLTGRIVPPKGQLEAIDALALLHKKQPGQFHLYFAGQVPGYDGGEYRQLLEKRIAQAGLGDCVHFLGEVADIRQIRSQMDLELVCAWCETFGRVTIEAMCARLPVIGTNTGGTSEIIVNEKTGLLYPPHDTQLLSEQILWCAAHPEQTRQMAEAGYQRVCECFSIQATVDKVYAVISQAVSSEREKP